jgi:hypothetical protein
MAAQAAIHASFSKRFWQIVLPRCGWLNAAYTGSQAETCVDGRLRGHDGPWA